MWIHGRCSDWSHLEVSFSVLTASYKVSVKQASLHAFTLGNYSKKKYTHGRTGCYSCPDDLCKGCVSEVAPGPGLSVLIHNLEKEGQKY